MRVSQAIRRAELRRLPLRPHLAVRKHLNPGPLGYPSYHSYTTPDDYVLVDTQTRTNLVFDADTIGGATRLYLSYLGGAASDSFDRNGPVGSSRLDRGVVIGVPELGFAYTRATWQTGSGHWNMVAGAARYNVGTVGEGLMMVSLREDHLDVSISVSTTSKVKLLFRASGLGPSVGAWIDAVSGQVVGFVSDGPNDFIVVTGASTVVSGVTYTLRFTLTGNTYEVFLDGVSQGSFVDTRNPTLKTVGVWTDDPNTYLYSLTSAKYTNPAATAYEVRNYDGDIVASGAVTDDHIDIPDSALLYKGHGPYGWYRVYLTGPDRGDWQWGSAYGDCTFCRVRTDSNFAANPPIGTFNPGGGGDNLSQGDEIAATVLRPTVTRLSVSSSAAGITTATRRAYLGRTVTQSNRNPTAGLAATSLLPRPKTFLVRGSFTGGHVHIPNPVVIDIAGHNSVAGTAAAYYKTNWADLAYSTRPRTVIGAFSDGTFSESFNGVITNTVALYKNVIKTWEPRNEPYYGDGELYITNEFDYFRTAVKAGDPAGRVIGPGPVSFGHGAGGGYLNFIDGFLAGCMSRGASYLDGLSVHAYNCFNGDLNLGRRTLSELQALVTANAYPGAIYQTEQGYEWLSHGWERPRHAARWTGLQWFLSELYGIPIENNYYWYELDHGFNAVPMWWIDTREGPGPQIQPLRTMAAEIGNRTFTAQVDFGTYGNQLYAGGTWTGVDGTKVVGLIAGSTGAANVTLTVTGTSSLTCVDTWGNTFALSVTGGLATFPICEMPQWVRVPAGVTVAPVVTTYGTNLALAATASTTSGTGVHVTRVNDGIQNTEWYDTGDPTGYDAPYYDRSDTNPALLPQTVTLDFGGPVTANRVVVYSFPSFGPRGSITDFDIDTFDGSTWTTRLNHPAPAVKTFLFTSVGRCIFESFWDEAYVFTATFSPASITKARVVIRAVSHGATDHPTLINDLYSDNGTYRDVLVQEIQVFNVTDAPPPPTTFIRQSATRAGTW